MTEAAAKRDRIAEAPIWLQGSFRLLFTGGALWALVVVALWVGALGGAWSVPTAMEPLVWHQHEMLFGYLGAVIAGFLSAAIPNWTGRPVMTGWPVAAFVGLWAAARLAVLFSAYVPPLIGSMLDVGFLLALFGYAARQIFAARNRNKPILIVLLLFAAACGLDHAAAMGLTTDPAIGMRAGFALVLMLIAIIGGRIIPAFTRNWLTKHGRTDGLPIMANRFDHAVLAVTAIALAGWVFAPAAHPVAWLLLVAGASQAVRLTRWAGLSAIGDLVAGRARIERDACAGPRRDGGNDTGGDDAGDARSYRPPVGGGRVHGWHLCAGQSGRAAAGRRAAAAAGLYAEYSSGRRLVGRRLPAVHLRLRPHGVATACQRSSLITASAGYRTRS